MATLALAAAGAAIGGALLPTGITLLGATITGATIGSQIGALAGAFVDQSLLGASGSGPRSGPRLSDLRSPPPPKARHSAPLWPRASRRPDDLGHRDRGAARHVAAAAARVLPSAPATEPDFLYYANFAVALCEGEITSLGRVWADGKELDLSDFDWRLHTGSEDQTPDTLIVAREGADDAPAYRGIAYIVFERMPLQFRQPPAATLLRGLPLGRRFERRCAASCSSLAPASSSTPPSRSRAPSASPK